MSGGLRIVIARTVAERADVVAVRIAVFVDEQGIPREEEIDEHDDTAIFCAGYDGATPVAAGRLVAMDRYGKIGRMAVLSSHRGHGHGAAVLAALEREGAAHGLRTFRLSAQLHAAPFYERAGYARVGDVYDEVGIPHVAMEKTLPAWSSGTTTPSRPRVLYLPHSRQISADEEQGWARKDTADPSQA